MTQRYWVVGGEYTDTAFETVVGGGQPERQGPFASYDEARDVWGKLSWARIDDAHVRYTIETEDARAWWVVGGEYADTGFDRMAEGKTEERHGPFDDYAEAQAEWQRLSWQHIDDAHMRYRIDHV